MLTLSVVVPATDRPPTLPACLAMIERAAGDDEVARRRGSGEAVLGVHHLAAVASVLPGVLVHARERRSSAVRGDG